MKRATLEEMKASSTWKPSEDSFLTARPSPTTTAAGMWVNILNKWYVMHTDVKTVGDFLTVAKRDGSTQEVLISEIVGTFEDKIIYKVTRDVG